MAKDIETIVKNLRPAIVGMRRALHSIPEPAYGERRTQRYIMNVLNDLDIHCETICDTGIFADIDSGKRGVNIAIRADMDALPLDEKTGLDFSSENAGYMHACGHDGHMAVVLGLAMALSKIKERFSGKVRLIFQPAEEKPPHGGAKFMIKEGVLKGVDCILGFHILPDLPAGTAAVMAGPVMAAADEFEIKVKGSGGHASAPEKTADTITAAAKVVEGLNSIASRMISPFEPVVISCGEIHGGNDFNIIPEEVVIRGTVRTFSQSHRHSIPEKMRHVVEGLTRAFDLKYEFEYIQCYPPLVNDEKTVEFVRGVAEIVFGKENLVPMRPLMGSEDFSEYLAVKRGCYSFIGGGKKDACCSLHSPYFDFDESMLHTAVLFFSKIITNNLFWK